jgi:hypothetical protein
MREPLRIFDAIKEFTRPSTCIDVSGTWELREQFSKQESWPKEIHPPYNFTAIGMGLDRGRQIASIVSEHDDGKTLKFLSWYINPENNGGSLCVLNGAAVFNQECESPTVEWGLDAEHEHEEIIITWGWLFFSYLAILASTKNIALVDYEPPLSRQVRRRRYRNNELLKFKVLAIEVSKKKYLPFGECFNENGHLPLHWVRGHFANYEAKPLFGHYTGTFWKAAHLRGNSEFGQITKDYFLKVNHGVKVDKAS